MADLRTRFSPKAFDASEISHGDLVEIFDTARWAPSAYNEQPWSFHVAMRQDEGAFVQFLGALTEGNRGWAKDASALVISVARRERLRDGLKNDYAWYDAGQAVAYLTMAALERGLQLHQMQGFNPGAVRELLNLATGQDPVSAIAIGRPAAGQAVDAPHRSRRDLEDIFALHNDGIAVR